jgi:hypothetical protein
MTILCQCGTVVNVQFCSLHYSVLLVGKTYIKKLIKIEFIPLSGLEFGSLEWIVEICDIIYLFNNNYMHCFGCIVLFGYFNLQNVPKL